MTTPPPPETGADASTRQRELLPLWVGIGGALLVGLLIGGLAIAGVFGPTPESEPTAESASEMVSAPTPEPTPTPTPVQTLTGQRARQLAEAGVSSNAEWTPYTEEINGVEMALVPAGCFMMGSQDGDGDEQPVHEVCFDEPFWIDVHEVTNAWFAVFLNEMGNQTEGGETWLDADYGDALVGESGGTWAPLEGYAGHPVIEVTWFGAAAYCEWQSARLPTEAEWEYAARGPDGLVFPWGNEFVPNNAIYRDNSDRHTWEVGSKPGGLSWVGALDLSGNVWEWVTDWYDDDYYDALPGPVTNPTGPDSGRFRVLRGGSWFFNADGLRAANREELYPYDPWDGHGFRCARSYDD